MRLIRGALSILRNTTSLRLTIGIWRVLRMPMLMRLLLLLGESNVRLRRAAEKQTRITVQTPRGNLLRLLMLLLLLLLQLLHHGRRGFSISDRHRRR